MESSKMMLCINMLLNVIILLIRFIRETCFVCLLFPQSNVFCQFYVNIFFNA